MKDRSLCKLYRLHNPTCEVYDYMQACPDFRRYERTLRTNGSWMQWDAELHHIFGGKTRYDVPSNIIMVSGVFHGWLHHDNAVKGRIVCLYAKWRKKCQGQFDADELDKAAGYQFDGWLENQEVDGMYAWFRDRLVNRSDPDDWATASESFYRSMV